LLIILLLAGRVDCNEREMISTVLHEHTSVIARGQTLVYTLPCIH